jgi:hypothetical protein
LLDALVGFAGSARPAIENPITEILAWLLREQDAVRRVFCEVLGLDHARFEIETQVATPRVAAAAAS